MRPPTLAEMAEHMGWSTSSRAHQVVRDLEELGLLHRLDTPALTRSRVPTAEGFAAAGVAPSARILPYPEACAELGLSPNPAMQDHLVAIAPTGAWLLGEQITVTQ